MAVEAFKLRDISKHEPPSEEQLAEIARHSRALENAQPEEIITWAVMDRDISVRWIETDAHGESRDTTRLYKVPNSSSDELISAYRQLTGNDPVARLANIDQHAAGEEAMSPESR